MKDLSSSNIISFSDDYTEATPAIHCEVAPAAKECHVSHTHKGYGACSKSGCPCPAFEGTQSLCTNCGHQYTDHW
jgi:hypothetical protein